eukprot:INCI13427.10.p1 GENE.INCI13427.10~~INCI13427.10.p1  ORF type:complete len:1071 (+),score=195.88 INCI13427.10:193-3405(+)
MLRGNRVLGILRESKNKWEQRAPLAPKHVERLVKQGVKVIVQPSTRRAFYDAEYARAGAILQDDVSPASLVLGVKEVPIKDLLTERSYIFFSHTTKAQDYNMPLLDAVLEKNIRLFDYEMITETGDRQSPRLVAFGRYAGIAGMIDICRGLGERMLSLGHTNTFMKVASTYMYESLAHAEEAVRRSGVVLGQNGSPADLGPLVFTFTGDGKVSRGAQEIFSLLPHEWVSKEDLPHLLKAGGRNADLKKVYGVIATPEDFIVPRNNDHSAFDKQRYYKEPHEFKSIFHETHLPYTSVLMNCMFWTQAYPRIVTNQHLQDLDTERRLRLLAVGEITCDYMGSVECLGKFSTIEKPFYMFDPQTGLMSDDLESNGILMQGVDTLPAELPKEATDHFGDHLMPLLPNLLDSDGNLSLEEQQAQLNPSWFGAMITSQGELTPSFRYISDLRANNERIAALHNERGHVAADGERIADVLDPSGHTERIMLRGHLFDNAVINKLLDIVEGVENCDVQMVDWSLGTNRSEHTTAVLDVIGEGEDPEETTSLALARIEALVEAMAVISPIVFRNITGLGLEYHSQQAAGSADAVAFNPPVSGCQGRSVLILGSGMVVGPALDVIFDSGANVTLASNDLPAAEQLAAPHLPAALDRNQDLNTVFLDMSNADALPQMVRDHDVTISLLPASMHVKVAELCIENGKHFVSASYESEAMRALDEQARNAGVTLLNEIGLDPGIDHMSAMQILDEARANGETVTSFSSICGGLPAPDAAGNPLGYKFSWNPAGVLQASQNPARFLHRGKLQQVRGDELMLHCRPVKVGSSALSLEQLPNRDSMIYRDIYGLEDAHTVYRGTIRYSGFAPVVHSLSRIGLFDVDRPLSEVLPNFEAGRVPTWSDLMLSLVQPLDGMGIRQTLRERLEPEFLSADSEAIAATCVEAFEFLGLFGTDAANDSLAEAIERGATPRDALCDRLQEKLSYEDGESDMVLLHHEFRIRSADGKRMRKVTSTLQAYGAPYPDGPSAMATTVGLPVGLAALMVLNGTIQQRGAALPITKEIYDPILAKLAEMGVVCTEREFPL